MAFLQKDTNLDLGEVLNVSTLSGLYEQLNAAVKKGKAITLKADAVEKVDAAAIQLLVAFAKSCDAQQVAFSWAEPSPALLEGADTLGLSAVLRLAQ